ncbi:hypothetical protein HPB50_014081 [Hyalomma asiaticum]|uniref:Uncharacterized protein n=1 Tax=Hyalomma asiaticum TaxID=266040 RepID=A0ACB7SBG6_HYAAI|nr:hypothetical protein HPB50_014081 [Hyalomma asiaticum]
MSCPQLADSERTSSSGTAAPTGPKPYNIFEDLEVFAHFEHYRSESYAQAIHLMASQTSLRSDSRQSYASCATTLKELSLSAPSSPKGVHSVEKSSTLPSTSSNVASFPSPKKSNSLSLSSFFRKISPRFHKNRKSKSKPWIVVEFSQKDIEGHGLDRESMADSDQSLELALQGKEQYMASHTGSATGRLCFSGSGSQSSLNAWVRAGKPKAFGPLHHDAQRVLAKNYGNVIARARGCHSQEWLHGSKVSSKSSKASARPNQWTASSCVGSRHSIGSIMPTVVVNSPGTVPVVLLETSYTEQAGAPEQPFAIPHSLSAGTGTVLLTGIPEKRRAQPPQSLRLPGPEGDPQVPPMERLTVRVPSTESIGACSLDVDASESSARPMMTKEASEVTLRSMVMSTRESSVCGSKRSRCPTKLPEHRPSYLGISCAINGYTNYSQFCRSRDSSPARLSPRTSGPLATSPGNHLKVEPILEIKASNGRGELTNGRHHFGPQEAAAAPEPCTSLVQQRIAALYGTEAAERVARSRTRTAKSPLKLEKAMSKRSPSCPAQVIRGRSKSPPVFRHLTRDFKEHLRLSEVSASPAENLPGFVPAAARHPLLGSPEKRAPFSATALRICDVDRGDSSALKEDILEESRNGQVVNGSGAPKLNGNHAVAADEGKQHAACVHVDKALDLPVETAPTQQVSSSLISPVCAKALSSSDLPMREGHTFLATLSSTQQVLERHIRDAEQDLNEPSLSEDMKGRIRAAIGKANLLINKKFKQFRELCLKNIEQNVDDPFPTTGSDLAGFWDMVMLQVDNVHTLFEELSVLKANNWVEPAKMESTRAAVSKPVKKVASRSVPASPRRSEKAEEAAKSRLEARKRLMEAKRQARQQQQLQTTTAPDEDIAIFVPQEKTN